MRSRIVGTHITHHLADRNCRHGVANIRYMGHATAEIRYLEGVNPLIPSCASQTPPFV